MWRSYGLLGTGFDVGTGCAISLGCNGDEFIIPHLTCERKPKAGYTFVVGEFKYQLIPRSCCCSSNFYTAGFGSLSLIHI